MMGTLPQKTNKHFLTLSQSELCFPNINLLNSLGLNPSADHQRPSLLKPDQFVYCCGKLLYFYFSLQLLTP